MRGGRKKKNATAEKGVTNTANWLLLGAFSPHHFCFFSLEKKKKRETDSSRRVLRETIKVIQKKKKAVCAYIIEGSLQSCT